MEAKPHAVFSRIVMVGMLAAATWMLPAATEARAICPGGNCVTCRANCQAAFERCATACGSNFSCIIACSQTRSACAAVCRSNCSACET